MECPKCGVSNPSDANFCMGCGSAFVSVCPSCGTELPAEARFCSNCGHALGSEPEDPFAEKVKQYIPEQLVEMLRAPDAGMQGERRTVTMLFCDVKGSTAAAETLDPEDWAEIMNGGFARLITPVSRFGGTLPRLMGDAILAFFGAPVAHEDDPERAILAGLDILSEVNEYAVEVREKWGIDFAVRIGINTGLVVVGEVGSDSRVEYTALGDAVNLAARMEQTAEPGTIQITEATYRLVKSRFEVDDMGLVDVKGKREPVRAYRILGLKAGTRERTGAEDVRSPLVGRFEELSLLHGLINEVLQGRGQIASLIGEAGLGKSRLVAELREELTARGVIGDDESAEMRWVEGRSFSYESTTPFTLVRRLLASCIGLSDDDDNDDSYAKVTAAVRRVMPADAAKTIPYLCSLLGIDLAGEDQELVRYMDPSQLRERAFEATVGYFNSVMMYRPLALVCEDLHWADRNSIDLLEALLPSTDDGPLLVLMLFRLRRGEEAWGLHEAASREFFHRYTPIELKPLEDDDSRGLVTNLLASVNIPSQVVQMILERAEGNPLYVEEILRSLLDQGTITRSEEGWETSGEISEIAIPESLSAVLTSRLDLLPADSKSVVQVASVVGRAFSKDVVEAVIGNEFNLDDAIPDLLRRGLIREGGVFPQRTYHFKHAMIQEIAYEHILRGTRRRLHHALAEYIEATNPKAVNDLARHFLAAGEQERSLPYVMAAGEAARSTYSIREAIDHFRQAVGSLTEDTPIETVRRAYEGLGRSLAFDNRHAEAVSIYEELLRQGEIRGDIRAQISALNKIGFEKALRMGHVEEGERALAKAKDLAEQVDDRSGLVECHAAYCFVNVNAGRLEQAAQHQLEAARIGGEMEAEEDRVFGLAHHAETLVWMTRYDEAVPAIAQARAAAENAGAKQFSALVTGVPMALYEAREGNVTDALALGAEATRVAAEVGASIEEAMVAVTASRFAHDTGNYEKALTLLNHADRAGERAGLNWARAAAASLRALVEHAIGYDAERIGALHRQAMALIEQPLGRAAESMVWADLAWCALGMGNSEQAQWYLERGLNAVSAYGYLSRPQLLVAQARVEAENQRGDEAAKLIKEARQFVSERKMRHIMPLIDLCDGLVRTQSEQPLSAVDPLEKAARTATEMMLRPTALEAHSAASRLIGLVDEDGANTHAEAARRIIHEVAEDITDSTLAASFNATAKRVLVGATAADG